MIKARYVEIACRLVVALTLTFAAGAFAQNQNESSEWSAPTEVEIVGYKLSAMEPCISLDGQFLFFNGDNAGDGDVKIFYARRISENQFKFLGALPGIQWTHRDMAPTLDSKNRIYFTTLRGFGKDGKSIYWGNFRQNEISAPSSVNGDVSAGCGVKLFDRALMINMDCGISPDGNTLVLSRAKFLIGGGLPERVDLLIASRKNDGTFAVDPRGEAVLRAVNTPSLEYAPAISNDGLQLYFTRFDIGGNGKISGYPYLMMARRASTGQPFGKAEAIRGINGFAEAPSLTLDGKELFFHMRKGNICKVYKLKRLPDVR